MKQYKVLISSIAIFILLSSINAQQNSHTDFDNRDFYVVDYTNYNNETGIWIRPDSLKEHSDYAAYGGDMFPYLEYLQRQYSSINYDYEEYLESLLPDSAEIEKQFEQKLLQDTVLNELLTMAFLQGKMGNIHVDSVQKILSRFYYLHRYTSGKYKGQLDFHICLDYNKVLDLPQNELSPFVNAFCWSMIYSNRNLTKIIKTQMTMPQDLEASISDEKLSDYENENYQKIIEHSEIRKIILAEYEKRKDYLNFELVY